MNCRKIEPLLSGVCEGPMPERERSAIQAHLRHCAACRRLHAQFTADRAGLRQLAHQVPGPETNVYGRALQQWMAERTDRNRNGVRRLFRPHLAPGSAAEPHRRVGPSTRGVSLGSAALALLLAAGLLSWRSHGRERRPRLATAGIPHTGPLLIPAQPHQPAPQRETGDRLARSGADQPVTPGRRLAAVPVRKLRETAPSHSRTATPAPSRLAAAGDLAYVNRDPAAELPRWVALQPG
jgi:hypothetical protein